MIRFSSVLHLHTPNPNKINSVLVSLFRFRFFFGSVFYGSVQVGWVRAFDFQGYLNNLNENELQREEKVDAKSKKTLVLKSTQHEDDDGSIGGDEDMALISRKFIQFLAKKKNSQGMHYNNSSSSRRNNN